MFSIRKYQINSLFSNKRFKELPISKLDRDFKIIPIKSRQNTRDSIMEMFTSNDDVEADFFHYSKFTANAITLFAHKKVNCSRIILQFQTQCCSLKTLKSHFLASFQVLFITFDYYSTIFSLVSFWPFLRSRYHQAHISHLINAYAITARV